MMAVVAAVLAFAGAPAGTPVVCSPTPINGGTALGVTHWATQTIEVYGPTICTGLADVDPAQRAADRRWPEAAGLALLVTLHEAVHVALQSRDECQVETRAFGTLPGLLALLMPSDDALDRYLGHAAPLSTNRGRALEAARVADAGLPAAYHGC